MKFIFLPVWYIYHHFKSLIWLFSFFILFILILLILSIRLVFSFISLLGIIFLACPPVLYWNLKIFTLRFLLSIFWDFVSIFCLITIKVASFFTIAFIFATYSIFIKLIFSFLAFIAIKLIVAFVTVIVIFYGQEFIVWFFQHLWPR